MNTKVKYGIYSAKAEHNFGSVVYLTPEGKEVYVTLVVESKTISDKEYGWDDKIFVGEVTSYVRKGNEGVNEIVKVN